LHLDAFSDFVPVALLEEKAAPQFGQCLGKLSRLLPSLDRTLSHPLQRLAPDRAAIQSLRELVPDLSIGGGLRNI